MSHLLVVNPSEPHMLLNQLEIYVHHKKIAVFFPVFFIVDFDRGIERIAKISLNRLFEPVDVLNAVIGVLRVMDMVKLVIVFLIFDHIRKRWCNRENRNEKGNPKSKNLFHLLDYRQVKLKNEN